MAGTLTFFSSGNASRVDSYTTSNAIWIDGNSWAGSVSPETKFHVYQESKKEEVKDMRGLFSVYVVDPEAGEVIYGDVVVAKDKEMAKFKVLQECNVPLDDLDDWDIICNRLGDVSKKKAVQRVRMVKDD